MNNAIFNQVTMLMHFNRNRKFEYRYFKNIFLGEGTFYDYRKGIFLFGKNYLTFFNNMWYPAYISIYCQKEKGS